MISIPWLIYFFKGGHGRGRWMADALRKHSQLWSCWSRDLSLILVKTWSTDYALFDTMKLEISQLTKMLLKSWSTNIWLRYEILINLYDYEWIVILHSKKWPFWYSDSSQKGNHSEIDSGFRNNRFQSEWCITGLDLHIRVKYSCRQLLMAGLFPHAIISKVSQRK